MLTNLAFKDVPQWEECGSDDNPVCRLFSHLRFLGIDFHVEAFEVNEDGSIADD
jgi:hypothetical protein